jgi:hypothetical protein
LVSAKNAQKATLAYPIADQEESELVRLAVSSWTQNHCCCFCCFVRFEELRAASATMTGFLEKQSVKCN